MRNPTWVSQNWRFRNDDGTLVTATWIKAEDTAVVAGDEIGAGATFRLRFNFGDTNNADSNNTGNVTLQYRVNTGGGFGSWTNVPTTAGADGIAMGSSSQAISDGDNDTTQRLTDITGATFNSTFSEYDENNSLTSRTWADDEAEFEFCLTLSSGTEDNIYEFRLLAPDAGLPDTTPAADASLTVYNANIVIDGSQTPDLDPDPLITTGNTPTVLYDRYITPGTTSLTFDGTGVTGGPYSTGIDHMGSGWGVGLAFVGYEPTITVSDVGGGNIVIDDAGTGSHQFTGTTPTAEIDHYRDVGLDTLQFTGAIPTVEIDHYRDVGLDTLQFTGNIPTVEIDHYRDVGTDTLLFTGTTPTLDYTWVTFPDKDDLIFTGYEPTLKIGITREPGTGSLEFTETTPSAEIDHYRDVGLDTLQFTGNIPLIFTGVLKQPGTGTLEFTEATPSAEIDHYRDVGLDTLQFTGNIPQIFTGILAQPGSDTLLLTGNAPSAEIDHYRDVGLDTLQFSSDAPTALVSINRTPTTGSLEFTGATPTLDYTWVTFPGKGTLQFSADAPTSISGLLRQPSTGSLAFTGETPSVEIDHYRDVGTDTLLFSSDAATINVGILRQLPTGSIAFTGDTPTLNYSWTVFPVTQQLEFKKTGLGGPPWEQYPLARINFILEVPTGTATFTGQAPSLEEIHLVSVTGDALAFTGAAPTALLTTNRTPDKDDLLFTGYAPSAEINHYRDVGTASLTFTGTTPDPTDSSKPEPDTLTGSLSFTGYAPIIGTTIPVGVGSISISGIAAADTLIANSGTSITNPGATTAIPSNYEQCDYTGFRQMPGSLKLTWNKHAVRRKSWESRHPQEVLRNVPERKKGSRRPEQADRFIEDIGTVDPEDL